MKVIRRSRRENWEALPKYHLNQATVRVVRSHKLHPIRYFEYRSSFNSSIYLFLTYSLI